MNTITENGKCNNYDNKLSDGGGLVSFSYLFIKMAPVLYDLNRSHPMINCLPIRMTAKWEYFNEIVFGITKANRNGNTIDNWIAGERE